MPTLLALRHVAFEDLGVLGPWFASHGFSIRYVEVGLPGWETAVAGDPDLLVVLGGPIGVYEEAAYPFLVAETALIRRRLAGGRPLLGICLGAQLIAKALEAVVAPMGEKEIGFCALSLTAAGRRSVLAPLDGAPVLHWHGDAFAIPAGVDSLATTGTCATQAFALASHVLALQFHLEVDPGRLEAWLIGHAAELSGARVDPCDLRRQAERHAPALNAVAVQVLAAWVDGWQSQRPDARAVSTA